MMVKASINTPPGSYLFTVRGSTSGTFKTSEDAVTVIVDPKAEQKKDEGDNIQPKQSSNTVEPSFSLDKLFAPSSDSGSGKRTPAPTGNAAWDRLTADEREKIEKQTKVGGVIGLVLGFIIVGIIIFIVMSKIDWKGRVGSYGCTCQNGSSCTKNSDCPSSAPGVPAVCGCPVN
jgi:hypothetical protein